ncbi:BEM46 family protein [Gigaspora margarita]|uniref:BEM46 family protein n=1 Tax=Gigaspora margarita TaxID=4874 RepID=A0A8H3X325_GIGMA|nr:BEM46 family protein [Gigaspora margarita]
MGLVSSYLKCFVAGMTFLGSFQCNLLYLPDYPNGSREYVQNPSDYGIQRYEDVVLTTQDKVKIRIYVLPQVHKAPTILTFHGNAGNVGNCIPIAKRFYNDFKCNVVMLSYRGYGRSEGTPTETGLKIDAQTALNYICNHSILKHTKIILYGQSLGGAVAIDLASKNGDKVAGLIVENTFLSIPKVLPHVIPQLRHLTLLCTQKWESEKAIKHIKNMPILFLSGIEDELIPKEHMKRLYDFVEGSRKELREFPKGNHGNTVAQPGYFDSIWEFLVKERFIV